MQTDQELSEHIERDLAGELPEAERLAFESALAADPALAETVALHRALRHSLGNPRRRQLLDALADVSAEAETARPALTVRWFSPYRMAAAAAVLVLIAAVGAWFYLRPVDTETPLAAEHPTLPPAPEAKDKPAATPPPAEAPKPEPERLALADRAAFTPNRALDPMAGTFIRGGNGSVEVTNPLNDAVLLPRNGKVAFALEGRAGEAAALTLQVYNNREADFAAGKPVFSAEIPVQDSLFSWTSALRLTPGRYYAVLTAAGEEEPEVVQRFFVGRKE